MPSTSTNPAISSDLQTGHRRVTRSRSAIGAGQIDRLDEGVVLKRIVECHFLDPRLRENGRQTFCEGRIRPLVRPEPEHPARFEMRDQRRQPLGLIETGTPLIQKRLRRMVDIDQDRVEPATGLLRIEPGLRR